jgi:hypothetical protein
MARVPLGMSARVFATEVARDIFPWDRGSFLLRPWRRAVALTSLKSDVCGTRELRDVRFHLAIYVEKGSSLLIRVPETMVLHQRLSAKGLEVVGNFLG